MKFGVGGKKICINSDSSNTGECMNPDACLASRPHGRGFTHTSLHLRGSLITRPPLALEIRLIRRNGGFHLEEKTVDKKNGGINAFMGKPGKCVEITFVKQVKIQINTQTAVTHCIETTV